MKRIVTLFLIAAILCGTLGCGEHNTGIAYHTELTFGELKVSGTDAALEIARAKELLFRIERGELTGIRAQDALDARTEAYRKLQTDASIAYVRYCIDVTNEANKQAYDALSIDVETLRGSLVDAALLLKDDPALQAYYDAETVKALLREDTLSDPSVLPLIEKERALVGEYEALSEQLRIEYKGKAWTGDEILSDPALSAEDFERLYELYLERFNTEAGTIFLELIPVRNEIAAALGYDSYADYRYACFGRTYSPEEARQLSAQVQRTLVPLLSEFAGDFLPAAVQLYGMTFEPGPTMERIGVAVTELLPVLSEPWEYMISHRMYDLGADLFRMPGSFTTYFPEYGAPFLFGEWTSGFESITTVVHEFGHFASYYLNGDSLAAGNVLDFAEIDSQGLELLTVLRYDTLYGDRAEAAGKAELFFALFALIDGCAEDAFQQYAYAQQEPTLAMLNAEYSRICSGYGLDALGREGRSWTQIQHTFQSPFYYISYATGAIAALELYLKGRTDQKNAADAYYTILTRTDKTELNEVLSSAGLHDPFASETVETLAAGMRGICRDRGND